MQCQKFNDRWTFEKVDQDDRLKAFYGDDNKIIVTLPVSYTHLTLPTKA